MEQEKLIRGTNKGAAPAGVQPKIIAVMPEDKHLKDPKEAALEDGYPGSCQL